MKFLSQINVNTEYTLPFVDGNNGQVLTTDGQGAVYWGSVSAGATSLDGLTDVEITSPQAGQILNYSVPLGGTVPVWRNITSPYAPIASPTFTGIPAAPTAPTSTNTTQIATTAFVKAQGYLSSSSSINDLSDVTISTATTGQILQWSGTQWVNATLSTVEYVSKVQHLVKCGVAVTKGQAVYVTSADGTNMIVGLASNATEATSSKVIGLAASTGAINDQIFVVTEGLIAGLNTSTANAGDPVWLGTGGNLIFGLLNKPVAPAHLVYLGVVTRVQSNNGEIFVNVQNGFELNELHDVLISSPSTGQLIRRDSDGLWKNWSPNFLTSYTETDPIFVESPAYDITSTNITNWNAAYNDKINSASFSTSTGVLTLTQQDSGTITVDLDGRYLESLPSHNHDDRYYTETESDSRFVNASGDTMSGSLSFDQAAVIKKRITQNGFNPVKTSSGVLTSISDNSSGYTYYVIETNVPQDDYQMGGFTIELFGRYGETNNKTKIDLAGYWNPEGNSGFVGFEAHGTNPQYKPTIEVSRNSQGNTAFIIYGVSWSYPIIVARDLWLGYNSTDGGTYGEGWTIRGTNDVSSYTNKDTVVWRNAYSDSNPAGYITGYTETDTLQTVTTRGASTNLAISANGVTSPNFTSTALMIINSDNSGSLQPDQGSPANKILSFRWQANEYGYIDTDGKVTLNGFKTPTGTASQFLKANGTVDSSTYLTTTAAAGTYTTYDYVDGEISSVNTYVANNFVPKTRTLTINGTSYDLSANRSWTITTADSTKVSKSGESHDTVQPNNLGAGDGGFYTVANGYGPSGGNDALIHIPYSNSDWAHQLAFDWALGNNQDMWFRTKNGGTWQGWRKVWHDGNFADNSSNWNTAYNDRITAAAVTGTSTKTLTLTQGDGGTVTATWTDYDTDNDAQVLTWTAPSKELEISNGNSITLDGLATEDYVLSQGFITSVPTPTKLVSPNGATVVAADSALPDAGHSFIHTLALGPGGNDGHILGMTWASTTSSYGAQIFIDTDPTSTMAFRSRSSAGVWTAWTTLVHSGNIGSQSVAYATSAGSATSASTATTVTGQSSISYAAHSAGANDYNLELYSSDTGDATKYVSLRFHQGSRYWGQIRYNNAGFRLTGGADDSLNNIYAGIYYATGGNSTNWNTAYGWGNHAVAGYISGSNPTISGSLTIDGVHQSGYGVLRVNSADPALISINTGSNSWSGLRLQTQGNDFAFFGKPADQSDKIVIDFGFDGTNEFEFSSGGNLTIKGTITEQSSIRFKENIQPLEPALAKVEQLNPVTYTKITSQEKEIGLIAEEVAELFPEVVTYNENGQPQGIQYQRLSVILLKAVQELTERVNKLENK